MSDFAKWAPEVHGTEPMPVILRAPHAADTGELAKVLSVRGGSRKDHVPRAERIIESMPVAVVADPGDHLVGWCGASLMSLDDSQPQAWMVAGLVVLPTVRRRHIGQKLLIETCTAAKVSGAERVLSVINARNRASIALHEKLGFIELERGPTFAGVWFDGGVGVLLSKEL